MSILAMIGFGEMWPVLLVVLVLFGGRKLPELARAMGTSITQFKRGLKEDPDLIEGQKDESEEKSDGESDEKSDDK